jgi:O-antigen/teichoic acid export membrane protein
MLGREPFGEFGTIQSTAGLFGAFAGLGIGITATKFVAELRDLDKVRCGGVIGFSLLVAGVGGVVAGLGLFLVSDWLASHTLAAPHLAAALRISVGLVLFGAVQGAYTGALSGFEAFKRVAWMNCVGSVLGVPLTVVGAQFGGLNGAIWGSVLQSVVSCAFGHIALTKELDAAGVRFALSLGAREWRLLGSFTLPAFLSAILATPAGWFGRTLLVNQQGGYAQAALVSVANQWVNLVTFLPWMMGGVLVPIFSNLYASKRSSEFVKLLRHTLLLNGVVSLAVIVPLATLSNRILQFYGPAFRDGRAIFLAGIAGSLFIGLNSLMSRSMQSANRAWLDLASNGIWAIAVIVGSWTLVWRYQGMGLVVAHGVAALVLGVWQCFTVKKLLLEAKESGTSQILELPDIIGIEGDRA